MKLFLLGAGDSTLERNQAQTGQSNAAEPVLSQLTEKEINILARKVMEK